MPGRSGLMPPASRASTGIASVASCLPASRPRPRGGLKLLQPLRDPVARRRRLPWRQEDEIIEVAPEALPLGQRRGEVGQVRELLVLRDREGVDRLEAALADEVAGVA